MFGIDRNIKLPWQGDRVERRFEVSAKTECLEWILGPRRLRGEVDPRDP